MDIGRLVGNVRLAAAIASEEIGYNARSSYYAIMGNPTARRAAYLAFIAPLAGIAVMLPGCGDENDDGHECDDGSDNDADFRVDYPEDPGCYGADDNSENTA